MTKTSEQLQLGDYFVSLLFVSVSVKFKSVGCCLKNRGEGRITGAAPDDVRIIIYLNDLGLYFLSPDSCWLEWRETFSHTLLKVCTALLDHILLIILISSWQRDIFSTERQSRFAQMFLTVVVSNKSVSRLNPKIPRVCLTANGCSDSVVHILTII